MDSDQDKETQVPQSSIYSKMSDAAMRHRNYETETAKWYTTILVAMLGFILSSKFGTPDSGVAHLLSKNLPTQVTFTVVVFSIALLSCYSIQFYHLQHTRLERYIDTLLEPGEAKRRTDILKMPKLKPRLLMMGTQILLALVTAVLIFLEP
ncbi:MAG: hypothetical protein SXV54_24575 [Chloroflexota bacterium]|nr:hypothetical protein [Chloroflexota bacterium]